LLAQARILFDPDFSVEVFLSTPTAVTGPAVTGIRKVAMAAAGRTFFHSFGADADPQRLLNPAAQVTEPWGGHDHGACDKCRGEGTTLYECSSCMESGTSADCPACQGRVRFRETCPACLGDGQIDHTVRHGIAAFPTQGGLYRYLAGKPEAQIDGKVMVELEGPISEERDLDADAGALLVCPEQIVSVLPLDRSVVEAIRLRGG
jgi:hypothetical protein